MVVVSRRLLHRPRRIRDPGLQPLATSDLRYLRTEAFRSVRGFPDGGDQGIGRGLIPRRWHPKTRARSISGYSLGRGAIAKLEGNLVEPRVRAGVEDLVCTPRQALRRSHPETGAD